MIQTFRINRAPRTEGRRAEHHAVYASKAWRKFSHVWLQQYPVCVLCACRGMVNSGARNFALGTQRNLVVDHITPHGGNVDLLWDQQNLETLCRHPCHDAVKQQHERNGRDADAWFRLLRQYIEECASAEHVAALANLIPEHVLVEIQ